MDDKSDGLSSLTTVILVPAQNTQGGFGEYNALFSQ